MGINVTIESPAIPAGSKVVGLVGSEGISELYRFDLGVVIMDQNLDPDEALRAEATLVFDNGDEQYSYHGILAAMELVNQEGAQATYRVVLVPRLWNLTYMVHSRIYTDNTILDIIDAVLTHSGLAGDDFVIDTTADYETIEHVCQYKESNFDFIARWMQKVGLYFFFKHDGDREQLVITDDISLHGSLDRGDIRYVPAGAGDQTSGVSFDTFMAKHSALPAVTKLKDYDYLHPTLGLESEHQIGAEGLGEIHLFGENTTTDAAVAHLAQVRAEEYASQHRVFIARGYVAGVRPNFRFTVEDHPNSTYNNKQYLCVRATHMVNQGVTDRLKKLMRIDFDWEEQYQVEVSAVFADVQYRAPRRTPWPRVDGYELAVVDGEADSEYAQLDDHGRYRCRIMFDESDLVDGSATTWVRMMQPHAGGIEGFHFPLRKATEVLLFFLGGDPDRPVVAGSVPNAITPSPVTSGNHSLNVIQTGGRNRLELEDQAGGQRITMSTPYSDSYIRMGSPNAGHEVILNTDDGGLMRVGDSYDMRVGTTYADDHEGGKGSFHAIIQNNMTTKVTAGDVTRNVVAGFWHDTVKKNIEITSVSGDIKITTSAKEIYNHATTDFRVLADGKKVELKAPAGLFLAEASKSATMKSKTANADIWAAKNVNIESKGANVEIKAKNKVNIDGVEVKTNAKGPFYNYTYGPCSWFEFATKAKITVGAELTLNAALKSETKIGLFNENLIGGKMALTIGASCDITFAGRYYMHAVNETNLAPTQLSTVGTKLNQLGSKIDNVVGPMLQRAAAVIVG